MIIFHFNTSHVTVYPCDAEDQLLIIFHFNTSHVTVYRSLHSAVCFSRPDFNTSHVTVYHYLQSMHMDFFLHFNTSHVTVYRNQQGYRKVAKQFQYIPCYGLSPVCHCWGQDLGISIHPMLRFIYLFQEPETSKRNFNTSHVTVYLFIFLVYVRTSAISIHPMLRFIAAAPIKKQQRKKISIHPMLRFIRYNF